MNGILEGWKNGMLRPYAIACALSALNLLKSQIVNLHSLIANRCLFNAAVKSFTLFFFLTFRPL